MIKKIVVMMLLSSMQLNCMDRLGRTPNQSDNKKLMGKYFNAMEAAHELSVNATQRASIQIIKTANFSIITLKSYKSKFIDLGKKKSVSAINQEIFRLRQVIARLSL